MTTQLAPGDARDALCDAEALALLLAELGCDVVAIDSSPAQVDGAHMLGLDARVGDGEALSFHDEFDAVFSNAVLHWLKRPDLVLSGVYRALRAQGRFVAECGGSGCVHTIRTALVRALVARGLDGESRVPWYFPYTR